MTELTSSGGLVGNFASQRRQLQRSGRRGNRRRRQRLGDELSGNSVTELTSSGGLAGNFAPSGANFNGPTAWQSTPPATSG